MAAQLYPPKKSGKANLSFLLLQNRDDYVKLQVNGKYKRGESI